MADLAEAGREEEGAAGDGESINDNVKFKDEFKRRLYQFVLSVIKLCRELPQDIFTRIIVDQLLRSITSILANFVEA